MTCGHCGSPMPPGTHGSPKRFCRPKCRRAAWSKRKADPLVADVDRILAVPREAQQPEPERELSLVDEVERILAGGGAQQPERDPELFRPVYQPRRA